MKTPEKKERSKILDIDKLLKFHHNKTIETKDISNWLECTDRHIQKFALKYDIPYDRIHGRKHYIWNEKSLLALKLWYERNNNE